MTTARVVLRHAESYTFNKRKWLKNVPQIVTEENEISEYEQNGYFHVKRLSGQDSPSAQPMPRKILKRPTPDAE